MGAGAKELAAANRGAREVLADNTGEGERDIGGAHGDVAGLESGARGAHGVGQQSDQRSLLLRHCCSQWCSFFLTDTPTSDWVEPS